MSLVDCSAYQLAASCPSLDKCPFLHRSLPQDICKNNLSGRRCEDYNCSLNHPSSSFLPPPSAREVARLQGLPVEVFLLPTSTWRKPRYGVREKMGRGWREKNQESGGSRKHVDKIKEEDRPLVAKEQKQFTGEKYVCPGARNQVEFEAKKRKMEDNSKLVDIDNQVPLPDIRVLFIPEFISGQELKNLCKKFGLISKFRYFSMVDNENVVNYKQIFVNFNSSMAHSTAQEQLSKMMTDLGGKAVRVVLVVSKEEEEITFQLAKGVLANQMQPQPMKSTRRLTERKQDAKNVPVTNQSGTSKPWNLSYGMKTMRRNGEEEVKDQELVFLVAGAKIM